MYTIKGFAICAAIVIVVLVVVGRVPALRKVTGI